MKILMGFILGSVLFSAIMLQTTGAQNSTANLSSMIGNQTSTNETTTTNISGGANPPSGCDPSYPDHCIKSPPPNLNCGDIPYKKFKVLPPDPHGFDRDKDGIGCES